MRSKESIPDGENEKYIRTKIEKIVSVLLKGKIRFRKVCKKNQESTGKAET